MSSREIGRGGRPSHRERAEAREILRAHGRAYREFVLDHGKNLRSIPNQTDLEVPNPPVTAEQSKVRNYISETFRKWERSIKDVDLDVADGYMLGSDKLFRVFEDGNDFSRFYSEAEREAIFKDRKADTIERFRGALFAAIAYAYLREVLGVDVLIMSPEQAFKVTKILHPDAKEIEHEYGAVGLDGFYVPDGLRVERLNGRISVTAVYEASLSQREQKYENQFFGFKAFKEDLGPIAQPAKFVPVVCKGQISIMPATASRDHAGRQIDEYDFIPIPFTVDEFSEYAYDVEHLYRRTGDHATLAELRAEREIQASKIKRMGEPALFRRNEV